jgi:hypothetical protein
MERVTEREISKVYEGVLASTGGDAHGDRFSEELLRDFCDQLRAGQEERIIRHNHNPDEKIGEILDVWIEEGDDGVLLLKGDLGLFESEEHMKEMFEADNYGGMSVSVSQVHGMEESAWEDAEPALQVEVPAGERHLLEYILDDFDIGYRLNIQKAGPGAAVFDFLSANQEFLKELVLVVVTYYLAKSDTGDAIQLPSISLVNVEMNIDVDLLLRAVVNRLSQEYTEEDTVDTEDIEQIVEEEIERMKSE